MDELNNETPSFDPSPAEIEPRGAGGGGVSWHLWPVLRGIKYAHDMSENERNGLDDFSKRFAMIAEEAHGYGVYSCIILSVDDPLSNQSVLSETYRGGRLRTIGMLQQALWHLRETG